MEDNMTKAQASDVQGKWKQQNPRALCEHAVQELSRSGLHDEVQLLSMYHCRECGEAIDNAFHMSHVEILRVSPSILGGYMPDRGSPRSSGTCPHRCAKPGRTIAGKRWPSTRAWRSGSISECSLPIRTARGSAAPMRTQRAAAPVLA